MKLFLLLYIFIGSWVVAQHKLPISETNGYIFTKENTGIDTFNAYTMLRLNDGSIMVSTYLNNLFRITNTKVINLNHLIDYNDFVLKILQVGQDIILLSSHKIYFVRNFATYKSFKLTNTNEFFENIVYDSKNNTILASLKNITDKTFKIIEIDKNSFQNKLLKKEKDWLGLGNYKNGYIYVTNQKNEIYNWENSSFIKKNKINITSNALTLNNENEYWSIKDKNTVEFYKNNKLKFSRRIQNKDNLFVSCENNLLNISDNINKSLIHISENNTTSQVLNTTKTDRINSHCYNSSANSYYIATATNMSVLFPHIKQFPRVFNQFHSNSIFALQQSEDGSILAGGYTNGLAIIKNNTIQNILSDIPFLNGGININKHSILLGEGGKGIFAYESPSKFWKIDDNIGFYLFLSNKNTLYLGTSQQGLWYCNNPKLEYGKKIQWNKIPISKELRLNNILTINEDKFGNIWMGQKGIAVYNPRTKKTITWHENDNEKYFGALASVLDDKKTLWFGNSNGELVYYDGKNENDFSFNNFKKIQHPLLSTKKKVTFMHQWKEYIILGINDKIALFNLQKWYKNKEISVRYLNPYEINLTAITEQNTILTDKTDETIWFSTSDNLYQWDIAKWLKLPTFKAIPKILLKKDNIEKEILPINNIKLNPYENSIDLEINYQTKDNLPRYINGVLMKKGEKPIFESPNLQTKYHFANLSSGEYVFYIRVCQQDGSFNFFEFPISIDSFLWQKWWFWLLVSLFPIGFIFLYFRSKNEIIQTKKKLTQLNLASLSNQFRPHFMLNALNSIASQMEDMPNAEKVISHLGDSINLLYGYSQKNEFTHDFSQEWRLVENFIEIKKILYLPELVVEIHQKEIIPPNYRLPAGLLQIPIENALLHGLRNKENTDYLLQINFNEDDKFYRIEIIDNGIGRVKASEIHQFKKNGKGLKTISEMVKIINQFTVNSIYFDVFDLDDNMGTKVMIQLNKFTNYEKIKL